MRICFRIPITGTVLPGHTISLVNTLSAPLEKCAVTTSTYYAILQHELPLKLLRHELSAHPTTLITLLRPLPSLPRTSRKRRHVLPLDAYTIGRALSRLHAHYVTGCVTTTLPATSEDCNKDLADSVSGYDKDAVDYTVIRPRRGPG